VSSIGFVGLGAMGSRMASRLVDAGNGVTVWNRTAERAEPLRAAGARVADSPADAARGADFVLTMVRDRDALREVAEGPSGVLAGLQPGSALIEMSTVGPAAIDELEQQIPEGAGLLDAPVLGSIGEVEEGSLRIFVGGSAELFERARPVLGVLGDPFHVGELGSGAAAKLVANSTLVSIICALGEAVALGDGLGLTREATFEVLAASPLASQAERRRGAIESGRYPPRFKLSLARKDAELVLGAAREAGAELRIVDAAGQWLAEAEQAGWGDLDYGAVLARILGEQPADNPQTSVS
jgi:3-hydroxyisobutyrate dehydrogenase/2-hydroxy-3-oxopropionate reductase